MRCLLAIAGVLVMAAPAHAQTAQRTCSGEFTDMRVIGLTLGDCDLNHISDTELSYVKGVCGEPWTPDSDGKVPKCTIKVVASRTKSIPRENHGYGAPLYQVRKVLQASAASLTLPRNVLGEWCHERDDDCEPDGVPDRWWCCRRASRTGATTSTTASTALSG